MKIRNILVSVITATVLLSGPSSATVHRFVSIDSGGMLGVIPAHLMQDIEEKTGQPMHKLVDGFMGTSTGAIISSLLLVPAPKRDQPYSAKEVLEFYKVSGTPIFEAATISAMSNAFAKKKDYSAAATLLKDHTVKAFEDRKLSEAQKRLIILSHNKNLQKTHLFDSQDASANGALDLSLSDAVRASSSIALVFGTMELNLNGETTNFVDAGSMGLRGTIADPTGELIKILEKDLNADDEYVIYSLGTGFAKGIKHQINSPNIKVIRVEPNVAHLVNPLMNMLGMGKDALASATDSDTFEGMIKVAEALKSTPEYKKMLADLTPAAADKALEAEEKTEL